MKLVLFLFLTLCSCSHVSKTDPLKNTKKIVKEEHLSLYQNGAFQVPGTRIKLIPNGPGPIDLASELAGVKARDSFLLALKNAGESVEIVKEGTKKSFTVAKDISLETNVLINALNTESQDGGTWIIEKSASAGKDIVGKSWAFKPTIEKEMQRAAENWDTQITESGQTKHDLIIKSSQEIKNNSVSSGNKFAEASTANAVNGYSQGKNDFVLGYLALPKNLGESLDNFQKTKTFDKFVESFNESEKQRQNFSKEMVDIVDGEVKNYSQNVKENFNKANQEIAENSKEIGFTLASLKALRWTLQGIFWDGVIKPTGKIIYSGIGYLVINGIVYPATLVGGETKNVGELLVEITQTSANMIYDIVAPTGKAAFATVIASGQWISGQTVKAASYTAGYTVAAAGKIAAPVVLYTSSAMGSAGKTTIQYVGVPLTVAGVATVGTVTGTVVGVAGTASGAGLKLAGAGASGIAAVSGYATAGVALAGGTIGSTVLGISNSLYEVAKATVVPTSYALSGGIVLSYGTMSQLAAHTILAASDAAYLVLSMEGPTYVVYAVTGKLGKGEDIPTGSVLDLEKMQNSGEEFKKIRLSEEETKKVLQQMESEYSSSKSH
ncbi:MAG: hypothetical protein ACXVCR_06585 [Bdellovibrio sp.]